jgi:hypothetical protein
MFDIPSVNTDAGDDGLMVKFEVDFTIFQEVGEKIDKPLLNISYNDASLLFECTEASIKIIRNVAGKSYKYPIYDRLFDDYNSGKFQIKVYFTSHFMFIAVNEIETNNNYLTPILFGLDVSLKNSIMEKFLKGSDDEKSNAFVKIGDEEVNTPYVSNMKIYSFKYNYKYNGEDMGLYPDIRRNLVNH